MSVWKQSTASCIFQMVISQLILLWMITDVPYCWLQGSSVLDFLNGIQKRFSRPDKQ